MTIILKPSTEALLLEEARQEGQDLDTLVDTLLADTLEAQKREAEEITAAVRNAMAAAEAGREKPLAQYLAEQRAKRGLPLSVYRRNPLTSAHCFSSTLSWLTRGSHC